MCLWLDSYPLSLSKRRAQHFRLQPLKVNLGVGSSTTTLMPVEAFVAADTKNKVLASNLHQRSRVGSQEIWAAVSPGISN